MAGPETDKWHYPSTKDMFKEVGLFDIEHYIKVFQQIIANYIVHGPILCAQEWKGLEVPVLAKFTAVKCQPIEVLPWTLISLLTCSMVNVAS